MAFVHGWGQRLCTAGVRACFALHGVHGANSGLTPAVHHLGRPVRSVLGGIAEEVFPSFVDLGYRRHDRLEGFCALLAEITASGRFFYQMLCARQAILSV